MSNETFQIIITAAVALAVLSLVVQGLVALAIYRTAQRMITTLAPSVARVKAILTIEKDAVRRLEIVVDKALLFADIAERFAPRIAAVAVRSEEVAARTLFLTARMADLGRSLQLVETAAHFTGLELSPHIQTIKVEAKTLVRSTGEQSRRVTRVFRHAISHWLHLRAVVASR